MERDPDPRRAAGLLTLAARSLHRVAEALGVSPEVAAAPREPHALHMNVDGVNWQLLRDAEGVPSVRRVDRFIGGQRITEESMSAFLTRDPGSPQHEALATFLDNLVAVHLAN